MKDRLHNIGYLENSDINDDGNIKSNGKPTLLFYYGSFCGYCTQASPEIQNLSITDNTINVKCLLIDGGDSEKDASKHMTKSWDKNSRGVPAYLGFDKNGKFKSIHKGGRDIQSLKNFCKTL